MKAKAILFAASCTLALSGCKTVPDGENFPGHELTRNTWNLVEIVHRNSPPIKLSATQQARHQLQFNRDGTLSMTLDCNRGNADWTASVPQTGGGTLVIGQVASTRAFCPPPSYGEDMAADLPSAQGYTIIQGGRMVNISTRHSVYIFAAAN